MDHPSRWIASALALTLGAWLTAACGGQFEGDGGGGGGTAGSAAKGGSTGKGGSSGGSVSGGSGGSTSGRGCDYDGESYAHGETFPAGDGCNTCSCSDGEVACTLKGCAEPGCYVGNAFYLVGEGMSDGCNSCSCTAPGEWACTNVYCPSCSEIAESYGQTVEQARACDPELSGQCSQTMFVGLDCGCDTFVNPDNSSAIALAQDTAQSYHGLSCGGGDVLCGACLPPVAAYCSAEGSCVDVYDWGTGAACKVGDQTYPSGSAGVPDPVSCATCTCSDGQLVCDDSADCPLPCPPDTAYATQCAQCSDGVGCEVVEHGCLPTCGDSCEEGACVLGVCRSLCDGEASAG